MSKGETFFLEANQVSVTAAFGAVEHECAFTSLVLGYFFLDFDERHAEVDICTVRVPIRRRERARAQIRNGSATLIAFRDSINESSGASLRLLQSTQRA